MLISNGIMLEYTGFIYICNNSNGCFQSNMFFLFSHLTNNTSQNNSTYNYHMHFYIEPFRYGIVLYS